MNALTIQMFARDTISESQWMAHLRRAYVTQSGFYLLGFVGMGLACIQIAAITHPRISGHSLKVLFMIPPYFQGREATTRVQP